MADAKPTTSAHGDADRVAALEAQLAEERAALAAERAKVLALTVEGEKLRRAYESLQQELALMRRRLFVAKAERLDTTQLELEFAAKLAALDQVGLSLGLPAATEPADDDAGGTRKPRAGSRPTGRRDLATATLPEERIELLDPVLEGHAERIGWEVSHRLSWRRGGYVRVEVARAKYLSLIHI